MIALRFLCLFLCVAVAHRVELRAQINPAQNIIGVDVSTFPQDSHFNYDSCFALAKSLGMGSVGMFQNWTAIESAPGIYNLSLFDIANLYYPAQNMPIDLTITPIHTNRLEVPSDLVNLSFDNPVVIARFNRLLDSVHAHTPALQLHSLVIGSEYDVYMGANSSAWMQYTAFYQAVAAHARSLWSGLHVATELTFNGIIAHATLAQTLNTSSDYIGVSYYPIGSNFHVEPLSTIAKDFAQLVTLFPSKALCFYQYGYPSSTECGSSELLQAEFIAQTFMSWDSYAKNIKLIDFTWLHDLDSATVQYYAKYYGLSDAAFLEYLRTIGLRRWTGSGSDKPAFRELQCQSKLRAYNALNIQCTSGMADTDSGASLARIWPIPAHDLLNVELALKQGSVSELTLVNEVGQTVKHFDLGEVQSTTDLRPKLQLKLQDIPRGVYRLIVHNAEGVCSSTCIIMP